MKTIRQIAVIAVASGVAVASLAGPAVASKAKPKTTKDPAASAAHYLIGNLGGKHHDHFIGSYTTDTGVVKFADYGNTADGVLSILASGVGNKAATKATTFLEKNVGGNLTGGGYTPGTYYPGSAAKLLLVAEAEHLNIEDFGGQDLLGDIVGAEGGGGVTGEYQNSGDPTYPSITIQSLAVLALAGVPKQPAQPSTDAISFLTGQQCADGSSQNDIRDDTTTPCDATKVDVDATSYAIQALEATQQTDAAKAAVKWLKSAEKPNGGWPEVSGKADANSTAIAVEALIAAGKSAKDGQAYLEKAQLGCSESAKKRGAVAYQGDYDAATVLRATAQAGVALAGKDLAGIDNTGAKSASPALSCKKK